MNIQYLSLMDWKVQQQVFLQRLWRLSHKCTIHTARNSLTMGSQLRKRFHLSQAFYNDPLTSKCWGVACKYIQVYPSKLAQFNCHSTLESSLHQPFRNSHNFVSTMDPRLLVYNRCPSTSHNSACHKVLSSLMVLILLTHLHPTNASLRGCTHHLGGKQ